MKTKAPKIKSPKAQVLRFSVAEQLSNGKNYATLSEAVAEARRVAVSLSYRDRVIVVVERRATIKPGKPIAAMEK